MESSFALKKFAVEDEDFILVPKSFDIHDAKNLDLLGMVTDSGYVWDEAAMKTHFPAIKIVELKKASLNTRRKKQ